MLLTNGEGGGQPLHHACWPTPTPLLCCPLWDWGRCSTTTSMWASAIPLSIVMAILIWIVLEKTSFGYELKATGCNK